MWIFESAKDLVAFREQQGEGVVALYLDDALDQQKLEALYKAQKYFDKLVGEHWHLLIPHQNGGLTPQFVGDAKDYDQELSLHLAEALGVPKYDLPALIFTDPNNKTAVMIIKLGQLTHEEMLQKIREFADIITRPRPDVGGDPHAARNEIVAEIRAREFNTTAFVLLRNMAQPARKILNIFIGT